MSTHSKPADKNTTRSGTRLVTPAIGLDRPDETEAGKFDEKVKCRTNPGDASSTTYEIGMTYFKEGSPEEWLVWKNRLMRCLEGQGATAGPSSFLLTRRLLMGRALAEFNSTAMVRTTETRENYLQCLQAVTVSMVP